MLEQREGRINFYHVIGTVFAFTFNPIASTKAEEHNSRHYKFIHLGSNGKGQSGS